MQARSLRWQQLVLSALRSAVLRRDRAAVSPIAAAAAATARGPLCTAASTYFTTAALAVLFALAAVRLALLGALRCTLEAFGWGSPGVARGVATTLKPETTACLVVLPGAFLLCVLL